MYFFQVLSPLMGIILTYASTAQAQYPPKPSNVTTIKSPVNENVTIHYKIPPVGTCTTVFETQKQYAGYVSLKPFSLAPIQQNYTVNTFFWFVEARTNASTAPLTIWINGGPGSSSMIGFFQESGPCEVIEVAKDKLGTQAREWGFDRSSNVLYIDQPNLVGYSYDEASKGVYDVVDGQVYSTEEKLSEDTSWEYLKGAFGSNDPKHTANTTEIAAHTIWHMLQGFLGSFPQYNPGSQSNSTVPGSVGVNLFAESYGGKFGPAFASLWEEQNEGRRNGSLPTNKTVEVKLTSLGIVNGCVDDLVQGRFYPIMAANNTYGVKALSLQEEQEVAAAYIEEGGCQDLIKKCRATVASLDTENYGDSDAANSACSDATYTCNSKVLAPYQEAGLSVYDITQKIPDPFPPGYYAEYLNTAAVQAAVGAPVNYTESNTAVYNAFLNTGDWDRGNQISDMSYLLSQGVRVALIYGDRDYICNWIGGEAVSFAVAAESPSLSPFYAAGYANISTNDSYIGGVVRQYGNLSFSRIYDAGHLVPAYQPETAFTLFTRIIMGTEISTGKAIDLSTYSSKGDANSTYQNKAPEQNPPKCFVRAPSTYCTSDQVDQLQNGDGVIINGVLYDKEDDWVAPPSSVSDIAGVPGTLLQTASESGTSSAGETPAPTTSDEPTGVFVASTTASSTGGAVPTAACNFAAWFPPLAAAAVFAL